MTARISVASASSRVAAARRAARIKFVVALADIDWFCDSNAPRRHRRCRGAGVGARHGGIRRSGAAAAAGRIFGFAALRSRVLRAAPCRCYRIEMHQMALWLKHRGAFCGGVAARTRCAA